MPAGGSDPDPAVGEELADDLLDELVPEELDWQRLVKAYPKVALVLAALGGFLLGRTRGAEIVSALSSFAAERVTRNINELLGEEIL